MALIARPGPRKTWPNAATRVASTAVARAQQGNVTRSRVRARVEHVFGHQANAMGGKLVRTIGLVRAKMKIGMQNLTYNMSRFVLLRSVRASPL